MTRGIPADLTGQRIGSLYITRRNGSDAQGNALWSCDCDCGNKVSVRVGNLKRGQSFCTKQCPLYQATIRIDILGQRFGGLVAIERLRMAPKSGKAIWQFRCDCGELAELMADNAMSGNTTSCGCVGIASRLKHGKSKTREYHRDANRRWAAENPAKVIANANKRSLTLSEECRRGSQTSIGAKSTLSILRPRGSRRRPEFLIVWIINIRFEVGRSVAFMYRGICKS